MMCSGENVILEAKHIMYVEPSPGAAQLTHLQSTAPVSIGVTEHHFLVLRPGQLQMLSNLSGALVQEEPLKSSVDGVALALVKDPFRSALWLVTTTSIFQVSAVLCITHTVYIYLFFSLYFSTGLRIAYNKVVLISVHLLFRFPYSFLLCISTLDL